MKQINIDVALFHGVWCIWAVYDFELQLEDSECDAQQPRNPLL